MDRLIGPGFDHLSGLLHLLKAVPGDEMILLSLHFSAADPSPDLGCGWKYPVFRTVMTAAQSLYRKRIDRAAVQAL